MPLSLRSLVLGAVLMKKNARGKQRAVAYASRTMNQAESKYFLTQQVTVALEHFRDIILGLRVTVTE